MTDATERNQVQDLKAKQLRAVDLLAQGWSDREAAEEVDVDPSTVWRWRTGDASFRAALNACRSEFWNGSLDRVRSLVPRALDVVAQALDDGDRQTAVTFLKMAGLGSVDLGRIGPVDAEIITAAEERELVRQEQDRVRQEQEQAEADVRAAERAENLEFRRALAGMPRS